MQVSVETTSGLERKLTVGIPATEIDTAVDEKLAQAAKTVKINGFRQGKVPMREVRRRYGRAVREEVLSEIVGAKFYEAVSQEKINPAGMPQIERKQDEPGLDFQFIATFEVYPEISISGLENVEVTRYDASITDEDLDNMIMKLREQAAEFNEVDRAAQDGDQVIIDFVGKIDGEAFEGGTANDQPLVLGSNSMIPGFEAGIEGAKAGEERDVTATFPEDYHQDTLKGKDAVFSVSVKTVNERTLPEVNEEFIKRFNPKDESLEGFKSEIRGNMERELKQAIKNKTKQQVFEGLVEQNDVEIPRALLDQEIDRQRKQMVQQFGGAQQFDYTTLPAELFEDQAVRSVKLGLLLGEFINSSEIKAEESDVRAMVEEIAQPYEDPQEVIDHYYQDKNQLQQVEAVVLEDKAVDAILAQAQVTDAEVSYEEALKPLEPKEEDEAADA